MRMQNYFCKPAENGGNLGLMQNGFYITSHYADLWLIWWWHASSQIFHTKIKNREFSPFLSSWPSTHLMFSPVWSRTEVSARRCRTLAPSPWRKCQVLSAVHFQIKTAMTSITCGAATCIPSGLLVGNTVHFFAFWFRAERITSNLTWSYRPCTIWTL